MAAKKQRTPGSFLDVGMYAPREGEQVWILAGQMADTPKQGTVERVTNIDNRGLANTYMDVACADGSKWHGNIMLVFDHKPRLQMVRDAYGECKKWL